MQLHYKVPWVNFMVKELLLTAEYVFRIPNLSSFCLTHSLHSYVVVLTIPWPLTNFDKQFQNHSLLRASQLLWMECTPTWAATLQNDWLYVKQSTCIVKLLPGWSSFSVAPWAATMQSDYTSIPLWSHSTIWVLQDWSIHAAIIKYPCNNSEVPMQLPCCRPHTAGHL